MRLGAETADPVRELRVLQIAEKAALGWFRQVPIEGAPMPSKETQQGHVREQSRDLFGMAYPVVELSIAEAQQVVAPVPHLFQHVPAVDEVGATQEPVSQQARSRGTPVVSEEVGVQNSGWLNNAGGERDQAGMVTRQPLESALEVVRKPQIVVGHVRHHRGLGRSKHSVAVRVTKTWSLREPVERHPTVCDGADDRLGGVTTSIPDNMQLQIAMRLGQHRCDRESDCVWPLEGGEDDVNLRGHTSMIVARNTTGQHHEPGERPWIRPAQRHLSPRRRVKAFLEGSIV